MRKITWTEAIPLIKQTSLVEETSWHPDIGRDQLDGVELIFANGLRLGFGMRWEPDWSEITPGGPVGNEIYLLSEGS